ncbi:MAG TPA: translation initiation factor [Candidatus Avirikenella pullistercoris]|nr:translation initiation factor [Candidatus Avirikenella pullistercoris]
MSNNDWKKRLNIVYSTNPDFQYQTEEEPEVESVPPSRQNLRITLDKRNRGGKQVTLIADFKGSEQELKDLCRFLKSKCGVGGAAKDGEILIQGDFRNKVADILKEKGYRVRVI